MSLDQRLEAAGNLTCAAYGLRSLAGQLPAMTARMTELAPAQAPSGNGATSDRPRSTDRERRSRISYEQRDAARSGLPRRRPFWTAARRQTLRTARAINDLSGRSAGSKPARSAGAFRPSAIAISISPSSSARSWSSGMMMTIAQFIARRDRALLREALRESARLQAELARQEAEEALRLTEAQFRAVFDGAAIGIAVVDRAAYAYGCKRSLSHDVRRYDRRRARRIYAVELEALWNGERDTFEFEQQVAFARRGTRCGPTQPSRS